MKFLDNISKIGKIDVLVTEGTTLSRDEATYQIEEELEREAQELFEKYNQVLIMMSSTNIDRLKTFYNARGNKKMVIDTFTYAIVQNVDDAPKLDFKEVFLWHPNCYKNKPQKFKDVYMIDTPNYKFLPNFIMLVKQSMIYEIRKMINKGMIRPQECLFVYSMWDGYIDKEEGLKAFIDELERYGIKVKKLHTSGHADKETLKKISNILNPNKTYVIHTTNNDLGSMIFKNYDKIVENKEYDV